MIGRLLDRILGHKWEVVGSFPSRGGKPPVVTLLCRRCGGNATIDAVKRG